MASITVNYNLKDAGYQNYANQKLRFTLLGAGAKSSTDYVVARGFVTSTSDANGDGSVILYRSAESGVANNIYEILLPGNERINVVTPDASSIELAELIVNHRVQSSTPAVTGINVSSITATTCDLNGGTIDGTVIGGSTAAAGTFTTIDVSDGNITNVGDINCDSISVDAAAIGLDINFGGNTGTNKITLADNLADSLNVTEGTNSYLKFITTDSSEQIVFGKNSTFASTTIADLGTVTTANIDGGNIDGTVIGASTKAAVTGTDILASNSIGYTTGNGGTVTQLTSKSTGVTLNAVSGQITMNNASLAHDSNVDFILTNSFIDPTDVIIVNIKNPIGASSTYIVNVSAVNSGNCDITLRNVSAGGGVKSDAVQLNFAIIKAVHS